MHKLTNVLTQSVTYTVVVGLQSFSVTVVVGLQSSPAAVYVLVTVTLGLYIFS